MFWGGVPCEARVLPRTALMYRGNLLENGIQEYLTYNKYRGISLKHGTSFKYSVIRIEGYLTHTKYMGTSLVHGMQGYLAYQEYTGTSLTWDTWVPHLQEIQVYLSHKKTHYRGTSPSRKCTPLEPYYVWDYAKGPRGVPGGCAFSYGRGSPVP